METLKQQLHDADIQNDDLFVRLLTESLSVLNMSDTDAADGLRVARPTIDRWKRGVSAPHPFMRSSIYRWFVEKIQSREAGCESSQLEEKTRLPLCR